MNDSKNYAEGLDARQTPATKWRLHFTNQIQQDEDWMTKLTEQKEIQSYLERIKDNEDRANNWKSCISTAKPNYGEGPYGGKSGAVFPLNLRCICFQHGDNIYDMEYICVDLLSGKPYRSIEKTWSGPGGSLASIYRQQVLSWQEFKKYAAYISAELANFYRNIDDNNWQEHLIPKNVYFQVPITKEEPEPQRDCGHKTIKSNEVNNSLQVESNYKSQKADAKSTEEDTKLMNENVTVKNTVKIPLSDFKSLVILRNPDYQEATDTGLPWISYGLCRKNGMALKRISRIKDGVALYQEIEYSELIAASKKSFRRDDLSGLTPQNWYEYCILRNGDLLIWGSKTDGEGPYHDETRYGLEIKEDGYFLILRSGGPTSGMFDYSKRLPIGFFADKTIDEIKSFIYDSSGIIPESLISVNDNKLELLVETDKYRVGK